MASTKSITITVISKEANGGGKRGRGGGDSTPSTPSIPSKPSPSVKNTPFKDKGEPLANLHEEEEKQHLKAVLFKETLLLSKQTISNAINKSLTRYATLTEDYMTEQDLGNTMKVINFSANSVFAVSAAGSMGGVAGAGIALAAIGVNTVINLQSRLSSYYQSLNASNFNQQFTATRLGLVDGGKGTEN